MTAISKRPFNKVWFELQTAGLHGINITTTNTDLEIGSSVVAGSSISRWNIYVG
jgi:hypothetical protein